MPSTTTLAQATDRDLAGARGDAHAWRAEGTGPDAERLELARGAPGRPLSGDASSDGTADTADTSAPTIGNASSGVSRRPGLTLIELNGEAARSARLADLRPALSGDSVPGPLDRGGPRRGPGGQLALPGSPAQLGLDGRAYAVVDAIASTTPAPGGSAAQLTVFDGPLLDSPPNKRRLRRVRKELAKAVELVLSIGTVKTCEPSRWAFTSCGNGCYLRAVPVDGCGDLDCKTCHRKLTGRRRRAAAKRFAGAPILRVIIPYPARYRARLTVPVLTAMGALLNATVEQWLRDIHHLKPDQELASEDWFHPAGDEEPEQWKPHHNFLFRGQALWLGPHGLRQRMLEPHVTKKALADLKQRVRAVWLDVFGEAPEIPVLEYKYVKKNASTAWRAHFIGYTVRTFPGWHHDVLGGGTGRGSNRRAYGLFRRGWPLFYELLHSPKPQEEERICQECRGMIITKIVTTEELHQRDGP